MTPRPPTLAALAAGLLLVAGACSSDTGDDDDGQDELTERQREVAELGADVMPFDLDATSHRFEKTDTGVVQTVTADDADDVEQVRLVREHLGEEAERFRQGDYSDPAAIHGHDMPGLADLEAGSAAISVDYAETPDGARLTFMTTDPALAVALHAWADAQVVDHGAHAEAGLGVGVWD